MYLTRTTLGILNFILAASLISCEIFTSTFQIANLLNVDKTLSQALRVYIQEESTRLDKLKKYARRMTNLQMDLKHRNTNPVNVFTSSRKFLKSVREVDLLVKERTHQKECLTRLKDHQKSNISIADYEGAKEALLRLQIVYNISPREFTNGNIKNYSLHRISQSDKIDNHSPNHTLTRNLNNSDPELIDNQSDDLKLSNEINNNGSLVRDSSDKTTNTTKYDSINDNNTLSNSNKTIGNSRNSSDHTNTSLYEDKKNHDSTSGVRDFSDDMNTSLYGDTVVPEGLSAMDNYVIGRQAYITGRRKLAKSWMENALDMMGPKKTVEGIEGEITRKDVLYHLAYLEYQFANLNKSFLYYKEILDLDQDDQVQQRNYDQILQMITKNLTKPPISDDDEEYDDDMLMYMAQCRQANDVTKLPSNDPRLTCRYENKHPGIRLKPVAVETISVDPQIEVFRGVLSNTEIDTLLALATPKLLRAGVNNYETGKVEVADYRISKTGWLNSDEGDIVRTINRRVAAITGLTTATAEALQINNYGIGGQYEPHYDHALDMNSSPITKFGVGNRIATLMFYLSDVEAGGATVFIDAGANTKPSKGDAVFWYNLKRSGESDNRTLHAGCPVLIGNKWVANKWLHEYGNEFLRPCGLNEED